MPNNEAQDRFNPPKLGESEFEKARYDSLNNGEIFWLSEEMNDSNHAYRKLDEKQAMNTRTREIHDKVYNANVYYKM